MLRLSPRGEIASPWTYGRGMSLRRQRSKHLVASTAGRYMASFKVVLRTWGKIVGEGGYGSRFRVQHPLQERKERSFKQCRPSHLNFRMRIVSANRSGRVGVA